MALLQPIAGAGVRRARQTEAGRAPPPQAAV